MPLGLNFEPDKKLIEKQREMFNGFVSFLDILGFKDISTRETFIEIFHKYVWTINVGTFTLSANMRYYIFSDTIVLYTTDDGPMACSQILNANSRLFYFLTRIGLPIRGCISYGELIRLKQPNRKGKGNKIDLLVGEPMVDAYEHERKLDWIGICLSENINLKIEEYSGYYDYWKNVLHYYDKIPYKEDKYSSKGYVIVPNTVQASKEISIEETIKETKEYLIKMKDPITKSEVRKKYQNTLNWLEILSDDLKKSPIG